MISQPVNVNGTIDENTILTLLQQKIFSTLNCIRIGVIQKFDKTTQTAIIQMVDKVQLNNEIVNQPLLLDVPCVFLGNSMSYLTIPVQTGDNCLLFVNDRDIENWYITNTLNVPATKRKHNISDCFALVGIRNSINQLTNFDNENINLTFNSNLKLGENISNTTNNDFVVNANNINLNAGAGLIQIANTAQSLFTILNTLLITLLSLKTGATPATPTFVIDTASVEALTTIQQQLAQLLKV